eukprot:14302169-Alexandrium_andersonii.AAC.1
MSAVYRVWSKCRLSQLGPWIQNWKVEGLASGIKGFGAQDAWYTTGLHSEEALTSQRQVAYTSVDLYKAFDQVNRMAVYAMMLKTGCPTCVVTAYASYMESLRVFGSYGLGCGEAVARPCAIPQGCPMSMV